MTFAAPYPLPFRHQRAPAAPLVPAVARAITLLDRLARGREPMTLARLASELSLPKSSVHGLCTTLVSFGYLRRQADGSFLIGPRVMGLAEAFVAGTDVAQEFNALWGPGGMAAEETVVLSVLSGNEALYVAVRNSARPLGLAFNVGMRLPAYLSGSGKAMLAQLPADEIRRRFAGQLSTRLTHKGPRDVEALQKELALTRKRGYSIDDEAVREGVYSFGAPVFDASGQRDRGSRRLHQQGPARQRPGRAASQRRARSGALPDRAPRRRAGGVTMAASEFILETTDLTKEFKGFIAVDKVNLRVRRGTIHALIGPNGAGKTTCFNLLTKFLTPTSGQIVFEGDDITHEKPAAVARRGVVRSFQISAVFPHLSVLENVRVALQRKLGTSFQFWRSERSLDILNGEAIELLRAVDLEAYAALPAVELSYGRKRALEIATTLAMDAEADAARRADPGHGPRGRRPHPRADQEGRGEPHRADGRAQHERRRVSIADTITVLQRGATLAEGPYAEVSKNPKVIEAYMGSADVELEGAH